VSQTVSNALTYQRAWDQTEASTSFSVLFFRFAVCIKPGALIRSQTSQDETLRYNEVTGKGGTPSTVHSVSMMMVSLVRRLPLRR